MSGIGAYRLRSRAVASTPSSLTCCHGKLFVFQQAKCQGPGRLAQFRRNSTNRSWLHERHRGIPCAIFVLALTQPWRTSRKAILGRGKQLTVLDRSFELDLAFLEHHVDRIVTDLVRRDTLSLMPDEKTVCTYKEVLTHKISAFFGSLCF